MTDVKTIPVGDMKVRVSGTGFPLMWAADTATRRDNRARPASGPDAEGVAAISKALTALLADMFALYVKTTKTSQWHMSDARFQDYHLLLDEQSFEILASTDLIAERLRKIGGTTLRSLGQIARLKRAPDDDTVGTSACWPSCSRTTSAWPGI